MHDELGTRIRASGLDWIVPAWPVPPRVQAFVTTRRGGVSTGERAALDLGSANDERADVLVNRARVRALLPGDPRWLQQVHGVDVVTLDAIVPPAAPVADAAVTATRGVVCTVRTADCLPVLFADRNAGAVGVAHAGWRGLAAGVLESTVAALQALGVAPGNIVAWLGPAIGQDAFEVGDEVRRAFVTHDPVARSAFRAGAPGKWHADLYALARQRLAARGVKDVSGGGLCTRSDDARFFSYRRTHEAGRMAALIWLA
jgi:YfiH family protein